MASITFCDDCDKEIGLNNKIRLTIWYEHPLQNLEFCYTCFDKHWKPINKRFSLKKFMAEYEQKH